MKTYRTIKELRAALESARQGGASIGLIPTMGALHEGHASLIRAAVQETGFAVVSVFVNPTQFGPTEDLAAYPRPLEADCRLAESLGAQAVFAPEVGEMYPSGEPAWVEVGGHLTGILCGRSRPDHFRGVTTVVAKLFNIVGPCRAYFGQKDGQQAQVVRRMAAELFMPVEVVIKPLIREADGLALSSRNVYLSSSQRAAALVLFKSLAEAGACLERGEREPQKITALLKARIKAEPLAELDYAEIYSFPELNDPGPEICGPVMIALAARVGSTRLIDNLVWPEKPALDA